MPNTTIGGAIVGGAFGLANTALTNELAKQQAERDRAENYRYNEMAAENAYQRQKEITEEYMTPEAQIRHLKEAGLSPSLMYGAGGGTQGVSTPTGGGGGNIQTPVRGMDITAITQLAQIANLEAQTRKTNAEADTEEGKNDRGRAEIDTMLKNMGLTEAQTEHTQMMIHYQDTLNYINDATKGAQIKSIEEGATEAENRAKAMFYEFKQKKVDFDFTKETYKMRVEQAATELQEATNRLFLTQAQIRLTDAQEDSVRTAIQQRFTEIELAKNAQQIDVDKFNAQLKQDWMKWCQQNIREWEHLKLDAKLGILKALTSLTSSAVLGSTAGALKGASKGAKTAAKPTWLIYD